MKNLVLAYQEDLVKWSASSAAHLRSLGWRHAKMSPPSVPRLLVHLVGRQAAESLVGKRPRKAKLGNITNAARYRNRYEEEFEVMRRDDPVLFLKLYRMCPEAFDRLLAIVEPFLKPRNQEMARRAGRGMPGVTNRSILGMTLMWLGGGLFPHVATIHHVAVVTATVYVWHGVEAIDAAGKGAESLLRIQFPSTEEERRKVKDGFSSIYHSEACPDLPSIMHGAVGALDGVTLLHLIKRNYHDDWDYASMISRKQVTAWNTQCICDADGIVLFCESRIPGSRHDSYAWAESIARQHLSEGDEALEFDEFLLADAAYRSCNLMVTPYMNSRLEKFEPSEKPYAETLSMLISQGRCTIERVFGQLVWRWLIFQRKIIVNPQYKAPLIIQVACMLHNYLCRIGQEGAVVGEPAEPLTDAQGVVTAAQQEALGPNATQGRRVDAEREETRRHLLEKLMAVDYIHPNISARLNND